MERSGTSTAHRRLRSAGSLTLSRAPRSGVFRGRRLRRRAAVVDPVVLPWRYFFRGHLPQSLSLALMRSRHCSSRGPITASYAAPPATAPGSRRVRYPDAAGVPGPSGAVLPWACYALQHKSSYPTAKNGAAGRLHLSRQVAAGLSRQVPECVPPPLTAASLPHKEAGVRARHGSRGRPSACPAPRYFAAPTDVHNACNGHRWGLPVEWSEPGNSPAFALDPAPQIVTMREVVATTSPRRGVLVAPGSSPWSVS